MYGRQLLSGPKLTYSCSVYQEEEEDQIKENEIGCACNTHGVRIGADRFLVGRPEGK
jgi:hypothetical protein